MPPPSSLQIRQSLATVPRWGMSKAGFDGSLAAGDGQPAFRYVWCPVALSARSILP